METGVMETKGNRVLRNIAAAPEKNFVCLDGSQGIFSGGREQWSKDESEALSAELR
jgi:hypothetical protein